MPEMVLEDSQAPQAMKRKPEKHDDIYISCPQNGENLFSQATELCNGRKVVIPVVVVVLLLLNLNQARHAENGPEMFIRCSPQKLHSITTTKKKQLPNSLQRA